MAYYDFSCKHHIMIRNADGSLHPMDEPYYEATEIAPGTWRILSSGDYSYLLAGEGQGLLIDSGYGAGNIRAYCEKLCGMPVPWIANTHEHFDHTANNGYFDLVYLTEKAYEHATEPFQSFTGIEFKRDYPVCFVAPGDVIPLPGRPVRVFALADHTPGGAAYLDPSVRILFSGDEIWDSKALNTSPAEFAHYLEKLAACRDQFDRCYAGNGDYSAEAVDGLLALCRRAIAGDRGSEAPPRVRGHFSETLPDGTLVYDRMRPRTGDGGKKTEEPETGREERRRLLTDGRFTLIFNDETESEG